jgi:branched-chain amino acid transport system substrate-binding protein
MNRYAIAPLGRGKGARGRVSAPLRIAVLVGGLAVLAGCASSGSATSSAAAKSPGAIKVDMIADLTGADASTDGTAAAGAKAAIQYINAHGGVDGAKIDLTAYDAQSTPNQALVAARQAVSDNPSAIIVAALSSEIAASQQVFQQAKIPIISDAVVGTLLSPTPQPWYFAIASTPQQIAESFLAQSQTALGSVKGKRIAYNGFDSTDTNEILADIQSSFKDAGAQIVDVEKSEGALTSFTSQAQKIAGLKPDAVISIDLVSNVVIVGKALKAAGYSGPYLGESAASEDSTFKALAGVDYQGQRTFLPPASGTAAATAASAAGVQTTGGFFGNGWAIASVIAEAAKDCSGDCSGSDMTTALQHVTSYTPPGGLAVGPLSFSATRHYGITKIQYFKLDQQASAVTAAGAPAAVN